MLNWLSNLNKWLWSESSASDKGGYIGKDKALKRVGALSRNNTKSKKRKSLSKKTSSTTNKSTERRTSRKAYYQA